MMQKRRSLTLLREASLVEHLAQKTRWLRAPLVEARLEGRLARVYLRTQVLLRQVCFLEVHLKNEID